MAIVCLAGVPLGAAPPDGTRAAPAVQLRSGESLTGDWLSSRDPAVIRWQGRPFAAPFEFSLADVAAIEYPADSPPPRPAGAYCFELTTGERVYGSLLRLDAEGAELELAGPGRLRVAPGRLRRFSRWDDRAGLVHVGPAGLADWQAAPAAAWRDEAGGLVTTQPGATLVPRFELPPRSAIELELSWTQKPDFTLALGAGPEGDSLLRAFRFEIWDRDLVVLRETAGDADLAELLAVGAGAGRVRLHIYFDQPAERCLVFSEAGRPLADLEVKGDARTLRPHFKLMNRGGSLQLTRLRIQRWSGDAPLEGAGESAGLHLVDGSLVRGPVAGYDAAAREFQIGAEGGPRVAAERVDTVILSTVEEAPTAGVSVTYQDSTRFRGQLTAVEEGALLLESPGFEGPLRLTWDGLRSLIVHGDAQRPAPDRRLSLLESDGVRLRGRLVDGPAQSGGSCLVWQPESSRTASPLRPGASGRIVLREPKGAPAVSAAPSVPQEKLVVVQRQMMQAMQQPGMQGAKAKRKKVAANPEETPVTPGGQRTVYLRTGDAVPGTVTRIDEQGVTIRTPYSDATVVPHDRIKAAELADEAPRTAMLTRTKRDRLLTLPRLQRDNPPTHVVRSPEGDYLRGRIVSLDDARLIIELRLERREIPRDRISRIIWLHPEDLSDESAGEEPENEGGPATRVQAVQGDGVRLTFLATRVAAGTLSGRSDVLGECHVPLDKLEQILFGGAIEQAAARLAYQQWTLQHAIDPVFARSDDGSAGDRRESGLDSSWVGRSAPDFELPLAGGNTFRLSAQRGRIVVLDFFTTWCGPCLEELPQVAEVRREFSAAGVEVVGVNLEESAAKVRSLLERRGWDVPAALDRDGAVAAKYGVSTIPQVFVIDREGKVVRHYVDAGRRLGEGLTEALRELLGNSDATPPAGP